MLVVPGAGPVPHAAATRRRVSPAGRRLLQPRGDDPPGDQPPGGQEELHPLPHREGEGERSGSTVAELCVPRAALGAVAAATLLSQTCPIPAISTHTVSSHTISTPAKCSGALVPIPHPLPEACGVPGLLELTPCPPHRSPNWSTPSKWAGSSPASPRRTHQRTTTSGRTRIPTPSWAGTRCTCQPPR